MTTPTWNQIAAPNFSAGNDLIAQAMEQLSKATTGFKSIADQYKDTIQKRNLGLIQEYVNSAKSPEELQSEAFKTGLAKLTGNMGGDYDTLAKAQLVDKAYDSLLSRKANQVSIASNEFRLTQDQLEANQKQAISNIFAINDPVMRQAAIDQAVKDKQFNSSLYLQTLAAELTGKTNQQTYDYNAETWDTRKEALRLGNVSTEHAMKIADRNAATAEKNAQANMLQAEAAAEKARQEKENTRNGYIATGMSAIDTARKGVQNTIYGSGLNTDPEKSWKKWHEKTTSGLHKFDPAPNKVVELIDKHPALKKLPDNLKILHAENALRGLREDEAFSNPAWWFTSGSEEAVLKRELEKSYKDFNQQAKIAEDNAVIPLYRKLVMEHAQKTGAKDGYAAAKDLGLDELTIYKAGIASDLAAELKVKYQSTDKSVPQDQWIENQIEIATNPDYAAQNAPLFPDTKSKATPSETIKFNSPAMQMAGFADYGTAFRFEEREAEKAAQQLKASAKANQAQTGNSLQQTALPPNVNKLISTPLDIVTNPSTIKTKPVADPLRQAASEQTPVATSNTAQPRQLTPTEAAQGERMQQAALSRLIGAKLEEKRAEVQKQFPGTPLKQIAKAATPVPSPLIPVESQNAFRVKENNLTLDFRTGKSTPTKDPVPMPKVTWKEPVQAVTINPIYAQLPQHKVVATFVNDGDTINARSDSYKTKGERARKAGGIICRIDSLEAPETAKPQYGKKGQPYGEEAAKILQQMVLNKEISIRVTEPTDGESNYGRDVCQIEVAGKDVSVELLRAGAVWLYREYNHYGQGGFDLESNARQSKLGLWGLPNPVYPPDFRHNGYQNP